MVVAIVALDSVNYGNTIYVLDTFGGDDTLATGDDIFGDKGDDTVAVNGVMTSSGELVDASGSWHIGEEQFIIIPADVNLAT